MRTMAFIISLHFTFDSVNKDQYQLLFFDKRSFTIILNGNHTWKLLSDFFWLIYIYF